MLKYIIDGYNMLHKISSLKGSVSPQAGLINYIKQNGLTGSRNNKVTVVFDGHGGNDFLQEKEFTVFYSGDKTADDVIKGKVAASRNKQQIIVVSDDREIRDYVKSEGARILRISDFVSKKPRSGPIDERPISCSQAIEINEEMEKIWLKQK